MSALHAVALLAEAGHPVVVRGEVVEGGGHEGCDGGPAGLLLPGVHVATEHIGWTRVLVHVVLTNHRVPEVGHAPAHPGLALLTVGVDVVACGAAGLHNVVTEVGPGLGPDLRPQHPPEVGDHEGAELRILGVRAECLYQTVDLYLEVIDGVCLEDLDGLGALVTSEDAGAHCEEGGQQGEGLHDDSAPSLFDE